MIAANRRSRYALGIGGDNRRYRPAREGCPACGTATRLRARSWPRR